MLSVFLASISCIFCGWMSSCMSLVFLTVFTLLLFHHSFSSSFYLCFETNSITSIMVFLTCLLCFLSIYSTSEEKSVSYLACILFLGVVLYFAFSSSNILLFYIFFEASLIPTLALIIGWGYQPERLQAGSAMMLYTVAASLPLLVLLIWRCYDKMSSDIFLVSMSGGGHFSLMVVFLMFGAFLVKLPMYSVHLWLPKAHVEAPLAGSMLLAGILLKLGGFGLIRMSSCFCSPILKNKVSYLISISMWGGLIAVMMCLCQVDMKALVAYSSVGHMGIVSSGVLIDSQWGLSSALITMFAHGLCSPALFFLALVTYKKSNTRNIPYMSGLLSLYPVLSMIWFVFCCINMAAPPTLNLVGELMIFPALWSSSSFLVFLMGLLVFFSASYNMYLYTSLNHGSSGSLLFISNSLSVNQKMSFICHFLPLLLILKSDFFMV